MISSEDEHVSERRVNKSSIVTEAFCQWVSCLLFSRRISGDRRTHRSDQGRLIYQSRSGCKTWIIIVIVNSQMRRLRASSKNSREFSDEFSNGCAEWKQGNSCIMKMDGSFYCRTQLLWIIFFVPMNAHAITCFARLKALPYLPALCKSVLWSMAIEKRTVLVEENGMSARLSQ